MPIRVSLNGRLAISTIVFATDFSAESSNSGRYAAALATHFGAELVVIHAFVMSQGAMDAEARHQGESSERRDLTGQLQQTAYTRANSGQRVQVRLLGGNPSDVISRFADGTPESLLVLGTHGGGRVERQLIGSVAERTLRRPACPTLTVGPEVPQFDAQSFFSHMLYATDCSEIASRAAPLACAMARSFASTLKVISIVDEANGAIPDLLADLEYHTHKAIRDQIEGGCPNFSEPRKMATPARAKQQILTYADATHSDLIILGVHRRKTIEAFDRNSVTIRLITEARCPVLTMSQESLGRAERA